MSYAADLQFMTYKTETTEGTDASPSTAQTVLTRNFAMTVLEADTKERNLDRPYFGAQVPYVANPRRRFKFEVELAGQYNTALDVPVWMEIARACGMAVPVVGTNSVTFAPISTGIPSGTFYYFQDGVLYRALGCRGSFGFTIADGEIPFLSFEMLGIVPSGTLAELQAAPAANYARWKKPELADTSATSFMLDGYAAPLRSLTMNANSDLQYRSLIGPNDRAIIGNRSWSGTAVVEMPNLATKNYFTTVLSNATVAGQVIHGTQTGDIHQIDMPRLNIGTGVEVQDEQGTVMLSLPITAIPSSAGNDEILFTSK